MKKRIVLILSLGFVLLLGEIWYFTNKNRYNDFKSYSEDCIEHKDNPSKCGSKHYYY